MNPAIPVSWGELFDKISILEIKTERLSSAPARANAAHELMLLRQAALPVANETGLTALTAQLKRVNETLWTIEDDIRAKEAAKDFGPEFVELARAVYFNNDERGRLKAQINALLKSAIVEEKQYTSY
jgi:Family of unknown function (DUF6165)